MKERLASGGKVHAPAAQDCGKCHEPHSSEQRRLQTDAVPALCLGCHKPDGAFKKAHLSIDAKAMDCTSCHDPHQSRDPALLNRVAHPPFQARQCDACHVGARPGTQ
jgi:predicted CXXCH cytochrome family protein